MAFVLNPIREGQAQQWRRKPGAALQTAMWVALLVSLSRKEAREGPGARAAAPRVRSRRALGSPLEKDAGPVGLGERSSGTPQQERAGAKIRGVSARFSSRRRPGCALERESANA